MPRPRKSPSNPDANIGVLRGWLAYDRRSFGDILSDWQQEVSPGDVAGFIRSHLHLHGHLSPDQFIQLVAGTAAPSKELMLYLSASVPPAVATPLVMRRRGGDILTQFCDGPLVAPPRDALAASRAAKLREITHAPANGEANSSLDAWRDDLLEHLAAVMPGSPLNLQATLGNLSRHLALDPAVFSGTKRLAEDRAEQVAQELAQLLRLDGDAYGDFVESTVEALSSPPSLLPGGVSQANSAGRALRFLRNVHGKTQAEFARVLHLEPVLLRVSERYFLLAPVLDALARHGSVTTAEHRLLSRAADLQRGTTSRIDENVKHFANDGLTTTDYLRAAVRHPELFYLKPSTLIGNIEGVVSHFAADGLTKREYLRAAVRQPQLFYQKPSTLIGNIEGVVSHFTADGLTKREYLRAAVRHSQLFYLKPSTLIGNIEGVVSHFAADGLTKRDYLRAAVRQPSLFYQKPSTLIGNIEGVVSHFTADGLTKREYLRAAVRQPSLFYQKPSTLIGHIALLQSMHEQGLLGIAEGTTTLMNFICSNPRLLVLADDNLHMREIAAHLTGRRLIHSDRGDVEQLVQEALAADADDNDRSAGSHARRLLLNALKHEGYLKGR